MERGQWEQIRGQLQERSIIKGRRGICGASCLEPRLYIAVATPRRSVNLTTDRPASRQASGTFIYSYRFKSTLSDRAVKSTGLFWALYRAQELCESGFGRPGLPVLNKPQATLKKKRRKKHLTVWGTVWKWSWPSWAPHPHLSLSEHKVKISTGLFWALSELRSCVKVEVSVPNKPYGFCGRKATLKLDTIRVQELWESRGGRPGFPVPNSPYGHCGRKAIVNLGLWH